MTTRRCGFIPVVGEANAGKSTLINKLVGQKVSIVSPKEHTTRYGVYGIANEKDSQCILVDTPGTISRPKGRLQAFMQGVTQDQIQRWDTFLWVLDAGSPNFTRAQTLLSELSNKTILLVLNKIDTVKKETLLLLAEKYRDSVAEIFMVSAKKKYGLKELSTALSARIPKGDWLFPENNTTQLSSKVWAEELTREKVFQCVHQEIPYGTHVTTWDWKESKSSITICQYILVQREKHRQLVLGHGGKRLRLIGSAARKELMDAFQKPVHLFLRVKVDPNWKPLML